MFGRKARLIAGAVAVIALSGGAVLGYDRLRGRFMDIDEAIAAVEAQNYRSAFRALERLAPDGDVVAQTMLGWLYARGRGTDQDFQAADEWLSRAAEQGHLYAMIHLADLHYDDFFSLKDGRSKNRRLAVEWYRRAAETEDSYSQRRLALALFAGQGVDQDPEAGLDWMERSVEAGNRISMYRLGRMYESGAIGERDPHKALELYRQGIRHGHVESARSTIELLREEKSPLFDLEEAYFWALIANQWWPDDPMNGRYFVSVAETVHRVHPTVDPQDYARATLGLVDEETDPELLRARQDALDPETWPYRLDEAARRRSEEAASAIIALWPDAPAWGESVEE